MDDFYAQNDLSSLFGVKEEWDDKDRVIDADEAIYKWKTRVWDPLDINLREEVAEVEKYIIPKIDEQEVIDPQILMYKITKSHEYLSRLLYLRAKIKKNYEGKKRAYEGIHGILYSKACEAATQSATAKERLKTKDDKEAYIAPSLVEYQIELGDAEDALDAVNSVMAHLVSLQTQVSRLMKLMEGTYTRVLLRPGMFIPEEEDISIDEKEDEEPLTTVQAPGWGRVQRASRKS